MPNYKATYNPACRKDLWPSGPWQDEHDIIEWEDKDTSYQCIIYRHTTSGHLCGYVAIDREPYEDMLYDDNYLAWKFYENNITIHGDVSYVGTLRVPTEARGYYGFVVGFDCHHSGDLTPYEANNLAYYKDELASYKQEYKTVEYVLEQCRQLAKQLKALEEREYARSNYTTQA